MIRKPNFKLNWKYALGEIALIFIGISLAIAFQNWNDGRREKSELARYLEKIAINVRSDRAELQQLKSFRDSSRMGSNYFLEVVQSEKVDSTDILKYFDDYGNYFAFFDVYFNGDQSGFETLKSAGFLNKLSDTKLETFLFRYYDLQNEIEIQEKSLNDFIESMESELFKANVVQQLVPLLERRMVEKNDVKLAHNMMRSPSFSGVNLRVAGVNTMQALYDEAIDTGDSLLVAIQKFNK